MILMSAGFAAAQGAAVKDAIKEPKVCCEQTKTGFFCLNTVASECKQGSREPLPTSCESTSYCKAGYCYDSDEGNCVSNTPQLVCNANGGIWSEKKPKQCELGCCILGDQAAFVPLVRCKKLSSFLGLNINYNTGIKSEVECVLTASSQEKGACVFEFEFEKTCKFTTREQCSLGEGKDMVKGDFYPGKLCTAEELGTNCAPTRKTTCVPGKDEVYFVDSCGNPTNIYDSTKTSDKNKDYWTNAKSKLESCKPNEGNIESGSCGNCNYLLGSYCRSSSSAGARAAYGDNICADLNCKTTQSGKSYKHGESWCVFNDAGKTGAGVNSVGSEFYKHICVNGEEVLEKCADFRQEECIQDTIVTSVGDFSQAACAVNRWQDCTGQTDKTDCENTDKRDCLWKAGVELFTKDAASGMLIRGNTEERENGACLPKNPPGLKFWEGAEAQSVCSQGNAQCIVTIKEDLFGEERDTENEECLGQEWENKRAEICMNLGDCGPNVNWLGDKGYKSGYNKTITDK